MEIKITINDEPDPDDLTDGGDCPACGAVESIEFCRDTGREGDRYECEQCGEKWYI